MFAVNLQSKIIPEHLVFAGEDVQELSFNVDFIAVGGVLRSHNPKVAGSNHAPATK